MKVPQAVAAGLAVALALLALPTAASAEGQTLRDAVFDNGAAPFSNRELARRMLSPMAAASLVQGSAVSAETLAASPIRPADERFLMYVPEHAPPEGYALLVFVPPWQDARLPMGWARVLDQLGVIFVTAAHSGNDASVLARRVPLALLAADYVMRKYPVNPAQVFSGGFSGGARVALRLAVGFPDLFRGALLNAGSDPIGDEQVPVPPRELLYRFQESVRLVYLTGERDAESLAADMASIRSMHHWCVTELEQFTSPLAGHEVTDANGLQRALRALLRPLPRTPAGLAACRSTIDTELEQAVRAVARLQADGQHAAARKALEKLDQRYGGLAVQPLYDLQ